MWNCIKSYSLILCLAILIASRPAHAHEQGASTLEVSTIDLYPLVYSNAEGHVVGPAIDQVKSICKTAKINCSFKAYPVERAYKSAEMGRSSALLTIDAPRFSECCLRSLWKMPWQAGIIAKQTDNKVIESIDDLQGKSLITIRGWQSPYLFFPELKTMANSGKIKLLRANTITQAMKMLDGGRGEFVWASGPNVGPDEGKQTKTTFTPLYRSNIFLWVSKSKPNMLKKLDEAYLKNMKNAALMDVWALATH